ncbi:MAG TPA: kelch repeat-containing protein [Candidatus Elarobacter sp.]|nr:kelch repeat-containing protein [Candidatus Elarobacter sp.]
MLTVFRPAAAFLTAAVLLAGCGGGGGSTHAAPPVAQVPADAAPAGTAPVTLTFIVSRGPSAKQRAAQAAARATRTGRQPQYITAATAAIKVTLTAVANPTTHAAVTPAGGLPQNTTLQVTSTAQNPNTPGQCGPDPANAGNIKCTETINLPLGDDSLTIATYDGFSGGNATGNIISQQRAVASVKQGVVNTFTFTLDANSSAFTVFPPAGVTAASGPNCTSTTISGASDISATCTATITGMAATNFTFVVPDSHGSNIPVTAPGAPVVTVTSSNNANFTATITGNTLTITPHSVNVSAKITLTATPANTSGAAPGDGLSPVLLAFTVANVPGVSFKTDTPTGLPRLNAAAAVINNILYVAGGTTKPAAVFVKTGSTQKFDPSGPTWTTLASMNTPRDFVSGDALLGEFYVVGGIDAGSNVVATTEFYDPGSDTWFAAHDMNHARSRHRAVTVGARLFVFGGDDSGGTLVATPEAYSPDTDTWTDLAAMPTPRDDVAVANLNGFVYVIGGRSQTSAAVTTVERYDPINDVWATVAPLPTPLRYQHAAVINGRIYVAGGYPGSGTPGTNTVYFYDAASNTWNAGPAMPIASNLTETSAQGNNLLYIVNLGANEDQLIELSSP